MQTVAEVSIDTVDQYDMLRKGVHVDTSSYSWSGGISSPNDSSMH